MSPLKQMPAPVPSTPPEPMFSFWYVNCKLILKREVWYWYHVVPAHANNWDVLLHLVLNACV